MLHELPHELGDFAVYYKLCGSYLRAVGLNLFSALFCYLGLFIGFGVNEIDGLTNWLLLMAAASFIYITVTHIIPELSLAETGNTENFWIRVTIVFLGLILGWLLMFLLALYEGQLKQLFEGM